MKFRLIEELFVAPTNQLYPSGFMMSRAEDLESEIVEKRSVMGQILEDLKGQDYLMNDLSDKSLMFTNPDFPYHVKLSLVPSEDNLSWEIQLERLSK